MKALDHIEMLVPKSFTLETAAELKCFVQVVTVFHAQLGRFQLC